MSEAKKQTPSIGTLAVQQLELAKQLVHHVESRNYAHALLNQGNDSVVELRPLDMTPTSPSLAVRLHTLPTTTVEDILQQLIVHEENCAVSLWQELLNNAKQACELIDTIKAKLAEMQFDEFKDMKELANDIADEFGTPQEDEEPVTTKQPKNGKKKRNERNS